MSAQISLTYLPDEDRLHLRIAAGEQHSHWWLTRRITLRLLTAWLGKLNEVAPPTLSLPWMRQSAERNLHEEHELSLEFDALRHEPKLAQMGDSAGLVSSIQLNVTPTDTSLSLMASGSQTSVALTRKESHALVEALGLQARKAEWLQGLALPDWIGRSDAAASNPA